MIWTPRTTVAAIIQRKGQFLLVEEAVKGLRVVNQPAGHLEDNESLIQAVIREVLEETAQQFQPQGLVGIYRYRIATGGDSGLTYLRYCFYGSCVPASNPPPRDPDILNLLWLSRAELGQTDHAPRSPMVVRCIDDYLAGQRYPLELLHELD